MRALILALSLGVVACASVTGADAPMSAAAAQTPAAPGTYPISVDLPAGTYRADANHTTVEFRIRHMDLSWFVARFDDKDATLTFDPADPSHSSLTASVGAASVSTSVVNAQGQHTFDQTIARAIGADASPRITFTSTGIERTGQYTARITGDLSINGQTHPVTLDATFLAGRAVALRGGAVALAFSAHGSLDRTQWGVTQWRQFTGDTIEFTIDTELVRT
jgi:polyisoprenoid-binding protein YceI